MGWTLRDKTVLITGAARGIGAETARQLHDEGARLVLVDVDTETLGKLAARLGSAVITARADVRDMSAVQQAVDAGIEEFGGIDIAVANAGIASYGSVLAVDPETFARVIDMNVTGVFHTVRASLPSVIEGVVTCSWCPRWPPSGRCPAWPLTTPARRVSNTSLTRCDWRSGTSASTSAAPTCRGWTRRLCGTPARTCAPSTKLSPQCRDH